LASQLPAELNICRVRGDTFPFTVTISVAGSPLDITGFTGITMTVDPSEEPADALGNLFASTGVITNALAGEVTFTLSVADADQTPGDYFMDMEYTDAGGFIRTFAKGTYQVLQDISK
jgi:hypothetical protein